VIHMIALFSFRGRVRRLPYALGSLAVFFSQHLAILIIFWVQGLPLRPDPIFYLMPFRWLVTHSKVSDLTAILALAYLLMVTWALIALAFRRAADANAPEWVAAMVIAPIVQIPFVLLLCFVPTLAPGTRPGDDGLAATSEIDWRTAAFGVGVGGGLTLATVAMGALVFGSYGYGMFVVSPIVIGAATGYLANRAGDIGRVETSLLVACATSLGGVALVGAALEGIVCVLLAAPIGIAAAVVGGMLGRAVALASRRPPHQMILGLAVLPLAFGAESAIPSTASFDTTETIAIHAPPEQVWRRIVQMDPIEEPPAFPFRLGIAYPLRAEIIGSGVGAARYGVFSTGTAVERVTEWVPERKLSFVVEKDVPGLRELSPYAHVHAPHVVGYFVTTRTSFELGLLPDGGTEIVEHTSHILKLDPIFYWLPLARWVVHLNNQRVLVHIKHRAEDDFQKAGAQPTGGD
jgi:uncharacterized membrane protein YhaH (DUF805 family)